MRDGNAHWRIVRLIWGSLALLGDALFDAVLAVQAAPWIREIGSGELGR